MALRLLLLRHAETDWNRERRYQGWTDTGLSDVGRAQAVAVGRFLAHHPLAAVWSSPLRRALDTAVAIAARQDLAVQVDPAFRELSFGEWEGLTVDQVMSRFPDQYKLWQDAPHLVARPGGETLKEARERVLDGLAALRTAHDGQTVCVVAHGVTVRILILEALGLGLERLWSLHASPTGLSELEFRDDWTALHRMNTLVHLDELATGR